MCRNSALVAVLTVGVLTVGVLTLFGSFASAQKHAPVVGPATATTNRIRDLPVHSIVVETRLDGSLRPLAGATVWLVALKQKAGAHGTTLETLRRWQSTSGDAGIVDFAGIEVIPNAGYELSVPFQGVLYRSGLFDGNAPAPSELRVFPVLPSPSAESPCPALLMSRR